MKLAVALGFLVVVSVATVATANRTTGEIILLALSGLDEADQKNIMGYMVDTLRRDEEHFLSCVVNFTPVDPNTPCHTLAPLLRSEYTVYLQCFSNDGPRLLRMIKAFIRLTTEISHILYRTCSFPV